ncbi:MAG: UDP-N-acetylmuramoyl-L-alanyl-D-glutamate--2,6-diaminopimelate ligase [Planctomycetota bacterium]|nr:MAG: UDP-N-acetylmuramoyl-L-alanyl-D-glutamate--2,6-diaminopimelate ligase [Planctomycetota bacterium]
MRYGPVSSVERVSLYQLLPRASFVGCGNVWVRAITADSRAVQAGDVCAVVSDPLGDGSRHAVEAVARGAVALIVQRPIADAPVPQCIVADVRAAYARICQALAGFPARALRIAGVTGTNGKTTTTWLIRSILRSAGHSCGVLGTIEYDDTRTRVPASLTTPDAAVLAAGLQRMRDHEARYAAIEISSHALDQSRAAGVELSAAVVTNVTHDHLDYHGDLERYRAAKARILELCRPDAIVVFDASDPGACEVVRSAEGGWPLVGVELVDALDRSGFGMAGPHWKAPGSVPVRAVNDGKVAGGPLSGVRPKHLMRARVLQQSLDGVVFELHDGHVECLVRWSLLGAHNVFNAAAAAAVARHWGISWEAIVAGLQEAEAVPGRLERVDGGGPIPVVVDYAHTEDALRKCLQALRPVTPGRLLCVFGAGGDRDREKRPGLARAAQRADVPVVTSDNPRSEPPERIIAEIMAGFDPDGPPPHVEVDRGAAIRWAIDQARPGDCVVIAGKGHETYQIVGEDRRPFDDRQVAREALAEAGLLGNEPAGPTLASRPAAPHVAASPRHE